MWGILVVIPHKLRKGSARPSSESCGYCPNEITSPQLRTSGGQVWIKKLRN